MLAGELVQAQAEMSMASQGAVEAAFIQCIGDLEADVNALFNVYLPKKNMQVQFPRRDASEIRNLACIGFRNLTAEVLYNMLIICCIYIYIAGTTCG